MFNKYLTLSLGALLMVGLSFAANKAQARDFAAGYFDLPVCAMNSTGNCRDATDGDSAAHYNGMMAQAEAAKLNNGKIPDYYPRPTGNGGVQIEGPDDFGYGISKASQWEANARAARGLGSTDWVIAPYPKGASPLVMFFGQCYGECFEKVNNDYTSPGFKQGQMSAHTRGVLARTVGAMGHPALAGSILSGRR